MVRGLDRFREHFSAHTDQYVLIGGTACQTIMDEAGLPFRATQDLDIVLIVEVLDPSFVRAFWQFVWAGGYEKKQQATGGRRYYRFSHPTDSSYPKQLELLARKPEMIELPEGAVLTPIPADDDDLSSLSAILMSEVYYDFLHAGIRIIDGLSVADAEHLIPLKALAWLNLSREKKEGRHVDEGNIKKHKLDVFRLYRVMDPTFKTAVPNRIREDMRSFLDADEVKEVDLKALEIRSENMESVLSKLRSVYVYRSEA
ncbi:MAG: hypothetical protein WC712_01900 [Candidatus Brocadiia bacterium]